MIGIIQQLPGAMTEIRSQVLGWCEVYFAMYLPPCRRPTKPGAAARCPGHSLTAQPCCLAFSAMAPPKNLRPVQADKDESHLKPQCNCLLAALSAWELGGTVRAGTSREPCFLDICFQTAGRSLYFIKITKLHCVESHGLYWVQLVWIPRSTRSAAFMGPCFIATCWQEQRRDLVGTVPLSTGCMGHPHLGDLLLQGHSHCNSWPGRRACKTSAAAFLFKRRRFRGSLQWEFYFEWKIQFDLNCRAIPAASLNG